MKGEGRKIDLSRLLLSGMVLGSYLDLERDIVIHDFMSLRCNAESTPKIWLLLVLRRNQWLSIALMNEADLTIFLR